MPQNETEGPIEAKRQGSRITLVADCARRLHAFYDALGTYRIEVVESEHLGTYSWALTFRSHYESSRAMGMLSALNRFALAADVTASAYNPNNA